MIYDMFALELFSKDPKDFLPGQVSDLSPLIIIEGQEEWEVEEILAVRLYRNSLKY